LDFGRLFGGRERLLAASESDASHPGRIFTNSGTMWHPTSAPQADWSAVASSADGFKLAAANTTAIYVSTNAGADWIPAGAPAGHWSYIASCADGSRLVAATLSGFIYTWQTVPRPVLEIGTSGGRFLSWLLPSQPFVLQQNSALAAGSWTEVAAPPILNHTNLHYELRIPAGFGRSFYRLAATGN
jgi:hypothetical protein